MGRIIKYLLLLSVVVSVGYGCKQESKQQKAKYVFFFIGDGMGAAHRTLAEMYLSALNGETGQAHLTMNSFPVQGYATTYSLNSYITCSAASGTALSTGYKTNNGMIAVSPDTIPYLTIAEAAKKAGKSVGILTNVMLNHATPAAFSAHAASRNNTQEIREIQLASGFDLFAGGYMSIESSVTATDKQSFYNQATAAGYSIISSEKDISKVSETSRIILFPDTTQVSGAMFPSVDNIESNMTLLQMFRIALTKLPENPDGFFMMLESGQIDWGAHSNDAAFIVKEVIAFDEIIREAFSFYQKHPDETLIVITADHETGGLSLGNQEMGYKMRPELLQYQQASIGMIKEHYKTFIKHLPQKDIGKDAPFHFAKTWFGLGTENFSLTSSDSALLFNAWKNDITGNAALVLPKTAMGLLNKKAGIGWTTYHHTGIPVPVSAIGVGSGNFNGYYDNTDIPKKITSLMQIELE